MKGIPKNNNFILEIYDNGLLKSTKNYTTIKSIGDAINLDYYTTRELNKMTENKNCKKNPHPNLKKLFETIKIHDIKNELNLNI